MAVLRNLHGGCGLAEASSVCVSAGVLFSPPGMTRGHNLLNVRVGQLTMHTVNQLFQPVLVQIIATVRSGGWIELQKRRVACRSMSIGRSGFGADSKNEIRCP